MQSPTLIKISKSKYKKKEINDIIFLDVISDDDNHYKGTNIWTIMILFENACYDPIKLYEIYKNKDQQIIDRYNDCKVLNIVLDELKEFKTILHDHENAPGNNRDICYGHWHILDWIYGRWNDNQLSKIKSHIDFINRNKDKTCLDIVSQLIKI